MASPRRIIGTVATVAALALPSVFSNAALAQEMHDVHATDISQETMTTSIAAEKVKFAPVDLRVAPGTTVVWTNNDPFAHTITSDDGLFDSGLINQGETFSFTFTEPGVYQYYCQPHGGPGLSGMSGTIVVEAPAVEGPPANVPAEETPATDVPTNDVPIMDTPEGADLPAPVSPEAAPSSDMLVADV
jgi:plastocyanin